MGGAVPHAIAFTDGDVVHFDAEKAVEAGLPGVAVDIGGDGEEVGSLAGVVDDVEAGIVDGGEVELGVFVAEPRGGRGDRAFEDLLVRAV
jgi:hypothetical protein